MGVWVSLLLVSSLTVEYTSDFSIPRRDRIRTETPITLLCVLRPTLHALNSLQSLPAMLPTHLTLFAVVCRCSLTNPRRNGYTPEPATALLRSQKKRVCLHSLRVPGLMLSVLLELPLFLSCTRRSPVH